MSVNEWTSKQNHYIYNIYIYTYILGYYLAIKIITVLYHWIVETGNHCIKWNKSIQKNKHCIFSLDCASLKKGNQFELRIVITGGWEVWGKGGEKEAEQKVPKHSCIEGVSSWLSTLWWRGYRWTVIHNNRLYTSEKNWQGGAHRLQM